MRELIKMKKNMKNNNSSQWMSERADLTVDKGSNQRSVDAVGVGDDVYYITSMSAVEHERFDAAWERFCKKHKLPYGGWRKDAAGMSSMFDCKNHDDPTDDDPKGTSAFSVVPLESVITPVPHPDVYLYDAEDEDEAYSATVSPFSEDFDMIAA